MPETTREEEMKSVDVACALHAPLCSEPETPADGDTDRESCPTCTEIARMLRDGEVPY